MLDSGWAMSTAAENYSAMMISYQKFIITMSAIVYGISRLGVIKRSSKES